MFGFIRRRRRDAILKRPFPPEWAAVLERNVPYAKLLSKPELAELEGLIQIFLEEKNFEGAGGFEMTDEARVTIAAHACLLLLHRENDDYLVLESIVVYPHAYKVHGVRRLIGGVVLEGDKARLGESHSAGCVVLAWDDVLRGARNPDDGHNVALHEFAHQLDQEDGEADGAPRLPSRGMFAPWARVLGAEFAALTRLVELGKKSDIDPYGATNPAEFFAVVTEAFFEKPLQLKERHPDLYDELALFYRQDPARRLRP